MSSNILKSLILLAIVLLIVAISSFWFSGPSFRDKDVFLEIEGPTQIAAGDEVIYKLKYENKTRTTLHDLDFVFFYPEGSTVLIDGRVEEDHVEDFKIEELAPGEKGEREFSAFLIGERGNIRVARATLSFRAGNLTSSFEKIVSLSTTIVSTPISLTLGAPPSAVSNGTIQYTLDYRNESEEDAGDIIIEFDYPDGFEPKSFIPNPDDSNNSWTISSLKKGKGGRISVNGVIVGREGEARVVSVILKRKVAGEYTDYLKVSAATVISNPVLSLDILANDSRDYAGLPGDRIRYTINYGNNSNITFLGMSLVVRLEGDMFDFSRLDTRGGLFDEATKTITWDASAVSNFANLWPSTRGKVIFTVALKPFLSPTTSDLSSDRFVRITAKFGTPNVPTGFEGDEVSVSASMLTKIGTQPALTQLIYYNDPDAGSSGPFPLQVGQETSFVVHWQLMNPGNDVENIKITAKLSPGVTWADVVRSVDGQPIPVFNANTSEVSWSIGKLPYGAGVLMDKYEASFRIKIKPVSIQAGGVVPLIDVVRLVGTDSFTKQSIIINKGPMDSSHLVDGLISGDF